LVLNDSFMNDITELNNTSIQQQQIDLPEAKNAQIMGILSVVLICCFGGIITGVLGYLAMTKGKKGLQQYESNSEQYTLKSYNQSKSAKLMGTIGLVLSVLYLVGLIIYFVLISILGIAGGFQ